MRDSRKFVNELGNEILMTVETAGTLVGYVIVGPDSATTGHLTFQEAAQFHEALGLALTCPACNGKGEVADYVGLEMRCIGVECPDCGGTGKRALTSGQSEAGSS